MKKAFSVVILSLVCFSAVQAQEWIQWDTSRGVPTNQLPRGREADYRPLYIIRAEHNGDQLIGKFNADDKKAYLPYNGGEIGVSQFEFLGAANVKWQAASNGVLPPKSVPGGQTANRETLYIGRVRHNGSIIPGKVHPSHRAIYVPYGTQELKFSSYEQLVYA